jgi:hypothetical protein
VRQCKRRGEHLNSLLYRTRFERTSRGGRYVDYNGYNGRGGAYNNALAQVCSSCSYPGLSLSPGFTAQNSSRSQT